MDRVEQMRAFIIKILYYGIWAAIVILLMKYAMPLFMPFVVAFFIAFLLKPLINKVSEKTPLSRKAAAVILLILLYVVVGTLVALLGARIVVAVGNWFSELPALYSGTIEPAITQLGDTLDNFIVTRDPGLQNFFETASQSISTAVQNLVSTVSGAAINMVTGIASRVPWIVAGTLICLIASFFFVVDYYTITSFLVRQLPERGKHLLFVIKDYVVGTLFRFGRAYLILMTLTFVEVSIGLLILRVDNPFLIALITAVVDILPVLGTGTIMIPWALFSLITGNYRRAIGLAIIYVFITVVRQFLEPRVVGGQIGLYPLLTLIAMFIGARAFGFWGLFGVPITLVVLVYLNRSGEINLFRTMPREDPPPDGDATQKPRKEPRWMRRGPK